MDLKKDKDGNVDLDQLTKADIYQLVDDGVIQEQYPSWFYNNLQWDDEYETEYDMAYMRRGNI